MHQLLGRTKDLRLALHLALAALKRNGLPGLHEGLAVLRGMLDRYWEDLHPKLDPDDGNDPLERLNILAGLSPPAGGYSDVMMFRQRMREAPLCNSRQAGRFTLRDIAVARGDMPPSDPDGPKLEMKLIDAAFADTSSEELEATARAAEGAAEELAGIGAVLAQRVGEGGIPDFSELRSILLQAAGHVKRYLHLRPGHRAAHPAATTAPPTRPRHRAPRVPEPLRRPNRKSRPSSKPSTASAATMSSTSPQARSPCSCSALSVWSPRAFWKLSSTCPRKWCSRSEFSVAPPLTPPSASGRAAYDRRTPGQLRGSAVRGEGRSPRATLTCWRRRRFCWASRRRRWKRAACWSWGVPPAETCCRWRWHSPDRAASASISPRARLLPPRPLRPR